MKKHNRPVRRSTAGNLILLIALVIMGAFSAIPFIYVIMQSFKPLDELFAYPPRLYIINPTTDNYYLLWERLQNTWVPFSRCIFNSVFVSVTATVMHVILSSMAAYPLAKSEFPGRRALSKIIVLSLLFTGSVTAIPQFVIMSKTGFMNSYWSLILPSVAGSMGLYLMQQFMSQLPTAMIEAARVDGAGQMGILWRIVMPSVRPAWLTLVVFTFQGVWNNGGSTFITKESLKTLPTVLQQITASGISQMGTASAASVIMMIPPIAVFLFTQSSVIETMAQSGIKE